MVACGNHYGLRILACERADPQIYGGSEATVKIAKADLVPTVNNPHPAYDSWDELVVACAELAGKANTRAHRGAGKVPAKQLSRGRMSLHSLPTASWPGCSITRIIMIARGG